MCLALHHEKPLALSGDAEGNVCASQYMTGQVLGCIGKHADSCEAIVFSTTLPIAVSGGIDTNLFIYDMKDFSIRLKVNIGQHGGISKMMFSKNDPNRFIAATTMGDLHLIDPRNGEINKTLKGHIEPINAAIEVPGQPLIATAGDDHFCRLFKAES